MMMEALAMAAVAAAAEASVWCSCCLATACCPCWAIPATMSDDEAAHWRPPRDWTCSSCSCPVAVRQAAADCAAVATGAAAAADDAAAADENACANASADVLNGCGCGCRLAAACRCSSGNTTTTSRHRAPSSPAETKRERLRVARDEDYWGNLLHIVAPWCASSRAVGPAARPWTWCHWFQARCTSPATQSMSWEN